MDLYRRDVQQDVRELGAILGDVLTEQQSEEAFETVETVRTNSIDYRDGNAESRELVKTVLDEADEHQPVIARAFTTYFELINLAEERERIRALREQSKRVLPTTVSKNWPTYWRLSTKTQPSGYSTTYSSSRRSRHIRPRHAGRR